MIGGAEALLLATAVVGVAGTVLPVLPGIVLIWGAALVYAWWSGFRTLGWTDLAVLTLMGALAYGADLILGLGGARRFGAGRAGITGALVGLASGLLVMGPVGVLLGPIAGAVVGELLWGSHWRSALRAGIGAGIGTVLAMAVRLLLAVAMLIYLVWQVLSAA